MICACSTQKKLRHPKQNLTKQHLVSGKLEQISRYCGGAQPSQQMLDNFKIPKPLKEYTLYLKQGTANDPNASAIDSTTTNDKGEFNFTLPSGEYVIISKTQFSLVNLNAITDQKYIEIYDQKCLEDWFSKGLIQFTVIDRAINDLNLIRNKKCDIPDGIPCLKYTGPLRP